MITVLFICTGNTCRSPMAEAIARHVCESGQVPQMEDAFFASAGVHAVDGSPVSPETLTALSAVGIEHDGTSKPLSAEMIRQADVVLGMTKAHCEAARALVSDDADAQASIFPLSAHGDIADPIGAGQSAYDDLRDSLLEIIPQRLKEVISHENRTGIGSSRH